MAAPLEDQTLGYFYGEEDKGLMDPAWERQQKKVKKCLNKPRNKERAFIITIIIIYYY